MTLEEAQAEILRLEQANTELTNERDTLSQNNNNLTTELERVRTLNQQYFNQLRTQYEPKQKEDQEPEPIPSCEDFAKTLNI